MTGVMTDEQGDAGGDGLGAFLVLGGVELVLGNV